MIANKKLKLSNKIINSKSTKKHLTLKERIEIFSKLPKKEKASVIYYDWKDDVGLEIIDKL